MKQENGRYAAGFLFAVATFVVMAIWLCTQYTPQRLWELFCSVRLRWLVGAAGLMVGYGVLESTELHLALKRFSPQQAPCDTFRATMIGQFFNCITPFASGGQPMQALYLMKKGVALSFASCSLLIKFIVYQFVLTLYSAVTLALCFRPAGRLAGSGRLWYQPAGHCRTALSGIFAQTDRTLFVRYPFVVEEDAAHKRADGTAGSRANAEGAGRILPGLCANPQRLVGNPSDVSVDCRAADCIFSGAAVHLLCFWDGKGGCAADGVRGCICVKLYLLHPVAGSGGRCRNRLSYRVRSVFSCQRPQPCHPAVEAVYLLPADSGGRGVYYDGRGLGQRKKENFSLIHPLVRGIIKEPQTTALRIDSIITR